MNHFALAGGDLVQSNYDGDTRDMGFESPIDTSQREDKDMQIQFQEENLEDGEISPSELQQQMEHDDDEEGEQMVNIEMVTGTREIQPDKLSFAGSLPVAYDQTLQEGMHEVIREVTEPTSPDPYYPEKRLQDRLAKQVSKIQSQEHVAQQPLNEQKFESPSKSDLMQINHHEQSNSHQILNIEQLEAIKQTVEKRISEKTSPNKSPQRSPERASEETKINMAILRSYQDPNQSFPETAFSDLQTERHASTKKGPRVTPDVRASCVSAKAINFEKEPKKPYPSHSGSKSKSISLASTVIGRKTPKIREEQQIQIKPLKEKVISAKSRKKNSTAKPQPKFIQKAVTKPDPDLKVPSLPLEKADKNFVSQSVQDFKRVAPHSARPCWENQPEVKMTQSVQQPLSNLSQVKQRPGSESSERHLAQQSVSARTTTRSSQLAFVDHQLTSRARQERLNQEQRALKLSLLKSAMKDKPSINSQSASIGEVRYQDPETGRQASSDVKMQIISQELIKNRPEVIDQMQQILDIQDGLTFRPQINPVSSNKQRGVKSLQEWADKNEQKKQRLRELSEDQQRIELAQSQANLICSGSEKINRKNQRNLLQHQRGVTITDWLYQQSFDRRAKKEQHLKKAVDAENQQRKLGLTRKARHAQPQYLDHYIKHKLSLEAVPEKVLKAPKSTKNSNRGTPGIEKFTFNEKQVQSNLLEQMRTASHSQFQSFQNKQELMATQHNAVPRKVQMLHSSGFNRQALNQFLTKKYEESEQVQHDESSAQKDSDLKEENRDIVEPAESETQPANGAEDLEEAVQNFGGHHDVASNLQASGRADAENSRIAQKQQSRNLLGMHNEQIFSPQLQRESFGMVSNECTPVANMMMTSPETFGKASESESHQRQQSSQVPESPPTQAIAEQSPQIEDQEEGVLELEVMNTSEEEQEVKEQAVRMQAHQLHQRFVQRIQSGVPLAPSYPQYSQRQDCIACSSPQFRWAQVVKPNNIYVRPPTVKTKQGKLTKKSRTKSQEDRQEKSVASNQYQKRVSEQEGLLQPPGVFAEARTQQLSSIARQTEQDFSLISRPITIADNNSAARYRESSDQQIKAVPKGQDASEQQLNESADILNEMQSYHEQLDSPQKVQPGAAIVSNPPAEGFRTSKGAVEMRVSLPKLAERIQSPTSQGVQSDRIAREQVFYNQEPSSQQQQHNQQQPYDRHDLQALVQQKLQAMILDQLQTQNLGANQTNNQ